MTGMLIAVQMKKRMRMMEITARFGGTGEEFPFCVLNESDNFEPTMKLRSGHLLSSFFGVRCVKTNTHTSIPLNNAPILRRLEVNHAFRKPPSLLGANKTWCRLGTSPTVTATIPPHVVGFKKVLACLRNRWIVFESMSIAPTFVGDVELDLESRHVSSSDSTGEYFVAACSPNNIGPMVNARTFETKLLIKK